MDARFGLAGSAGEDAIAAEERKKELEPVLERAVLARTQPRRLKTELVKSSLTPAGQKTILFSALIRLKLAKRSEAKSTNRSFASKYLKFKTF